MDYGQPMQAAQGQEKSAYARNGIAGATNRIDGPPKQTAIGSLSGQIDSHNEMLATFTARLDSLILRLVGPQPCDPSKGCDAPLPDNALAIMEDRLRTQHQLICRIRDAVNVLDNLA